MKKGKNVILLIGIVCNFAVVVWQVTQFIYHCVTALTTNNLTYFLVSDLLPAVLPLLLLIIPVVLLVRNSKNKMGTTLPIISIIIHSMVLLLTLFNLFALGIPQHLIYSELGLINTYFDVIMHYLKSGRLLFVIGYALLIIGSVLSLPKKRQEI